MVYEAYRPNNGPALGLFAVDRFLININLGPPPTNLTRQTYFGIYNISSFDLSFSVMCRDGSDCNISHVPVQDLYMCDNMGRKVSVNKSCQTVPLATSSLPVRASLIRSKCTLYLFPFVDQ